MPKILDQRVAALIRSGVPKSTAYAIAVSQLQREGKLKKGTLKLASKKRRKKRKRK